MVHGNFGIYTIDTSIATCIGNGESDLSKSGEGTLVIDIGSETTDIGFVTNGNTIVKNTIEIGGKKEDDLLIKYIKKRYNILVGKNTAEKIKIEAGTAYPLSEDIEYTAGGRNLSTGLPMKFTISSSEIMKAVMPALNKISSECKKVIERIPPEYSEKLLEKGAILSGGGSLLLGMKEYMAKSLNIRTKLANMPTEIACIGAGKYLEKFDEYEKFCKR